MASRDKGLHFQPPCPQRVPTLTSGDHRHGAAGYLQFQGYARFPFRFQQSCSGSLLWSGLPASCAAALSHTHTLARPAKSLKHPLSHISEHSRTRGPFISLPNSNHLSQETRVPTSGIQEQPLTHTTSQPLDAGLLFTEKTLSLIYSLVRNTD